MLSLLAKAEVPEGGDMSLRLVVLWAAAVVGVATLAFIPGRLARRRRHSHADAIAAFSVLWALVATTSLIYASISQTKSAREQALRIQSGYYEAATDPGVAPLPWEQWAALAAVYAVLAIYSQARRAAATG